MLLWLAGCWLTDAEVVDRLQADVTGDQADADADTDADADADTDADSDSDTDADTDSDTDADTDSDTDTDTDVFDPLACADGDLGAVTGSTNGDNLAATDEHLGTCGAPASGGQEVALRWTAPSTGCFSFQTAGSSYDTVLYLLGTCIGPELACNDDVDGTEAWSLVRAPVEQGEQLLVVVDSASDATGVFQLAIAPSLTIDADGDVGTATGAPAVTGNTSSADSTFNPAACPYDSGKDVFVRWTAPITGTWRFTTEGSSFDTVLSLHHECALDAFLCADDASSTGGEVITTQLMAGEALLIRIGGWNEQSGDYALGITLQ